MKKLFLSLGLFLGFSTLLHAQWSLNGTNTYNTNGGNVGIGTQTPSNYFHGGSSKVLEIFNSNTTNNSQSHVILSTGATLTGSSAGTLTWVSKNSTGLQGIAYIGGILQADATTNAAGKIVFATSNGSTISQKMLIDKDGNVGIGTTNPQTKLDISGGVFAVGSESHFASGTYVDPIAGKAYDVKIGSNGLAVDGASAFNKGISIGTSNLPSGYMFSVNGGAIVTSMTVKLSSAWPDYVFKKDYRLPSLSEVKSYIDQNQHLPEVPSEEQIAKEGLNLGEMNKLLMKKVEELTLYLIEQDKEGKKQVEVNNALKTKLKEQQEQIDLLYKKIGNHNHD